VAVAGRNRSGLKCRTGFVVLMFVVVAVVVIELKLLVVLSLLIFTVAVAFGGSSTGFDGGRSRASPADMGLSSSRLVTRGILADAGRMLTKWENLQIHSSLYSVLSLFRQKG
jgi:hypothetical protein